MNAERLKREWTGRRVTVADDSEARLRFAGRTGTVVTANMNGRLLVRFDGLADIGWYDLAPEDLRLAAEPPPPEETAPPPPGQPPVTSFTGPKAEAALASSPPPPAKPNPKSVLELARQQGAAKPKP